MTDMFRPGENGLAPGTDPADRIRPIDPDAPISGHRVPAAPAGVGVASDAPEHDWSAARSHIFPVLRPADMQGLTAEELASAVTTSTGITHTQALVRQGPAGLKVAYALAASGFDVLVNGEHLVGWGIDGATVDEAAMANMASWSAEAPWTDEVDGPRRLLSSDSGDGWDASRILLPEVRRHLAAELGREGRILIGLPERHLLLAATLPPGDPDFAALFADFVLEHSADADEPIDRRVFELVGDEIVEFTPW